MLVLTSPEFLKHIVCAKSYFILFWFYSRLNEDKGRELFEISLKQLLHSITALMLYETDSTLLVQGACLKYFPFTIPDILSVFDGIELW